MGAAWLLVGIVAGTCLSGCASTRIRRISAQDFLDQAKQIGQLNSFHWTSYVGASPDRAYLESGYPAPFGKGTRITVYWTPLSELPADIAAQLKNGTPPWKSWRPETNVAKRAMPRVGP